MTIRKDGDVVIATGLASIQGSRPIWTARAITSGTKNTPVMVIFGNINLINLIMVVML